MRAASRAVLASVGLLACSATPIEAQPLPAAATPARESTTATPAASPSEASPTAAGDVVTRAQAFVAAQRALREGRRDDARRDFAASVQALPELADHALFHEARLARDAGDRDAARAALDRLMVAHPDSVWRDEGAVDRGRMALESGNADEAATWFARALDASDGATAAAAKLGLAQAEAARGNAAAAYDLVDPLRGRPGALGSDARTLGESLEALGAAKLGVSPGELELRRARARLREGRAAEARAVLAPLLAPEQPLRAEAALIEARSWGKAAPAEAAAAYAIAIEASSAADVAGTALFERGKAAWNRDENGTADEDFKVLLERFPAHQSAAEALAARARIADARGDGATAIALHEEVAARYPDSRFAADSAWRAAFVRYQSGAYRDAAAAFAALGERDDARYWQARALDRAGDADAARALLEALRATSPISYFAWWVDVRAGAPRTRPDFPRAGGGARSTPSVPPALGGAAAYHESRGRILVTLGLPREAVREYAAVERIGGPEPFLVAAYRDAGAWDAMVRTAIRLQQSGRTGLEEALYPEPYASAFARGGAAAGVDPLLLTAMARQESLFDPRATSSANARGVLQLLPETAARVAGAPVANEALEDPVQNIDLAARYLASLLQRFDGRLILAIAAYNGGPEAAERWRARAAGAPGDELVETISYRETREYVKAVLRNYRAYRLLYGDGPLPRLNLD